MILNTWIQAVADVAGMPTRGGCHRRPKAAAPVAVELQLLESREVLTASLNISSAIVDPTTSVVTSPDDNSSQSSNLTVAHFATANVSENHGTSRGAINAVASSYKYSAVTIKNTTNIALNYSFNWKNGTVKTFTLNPGSSRVHYISGLNNTGTISFDKSFASGYQKQTYSLSARNITRAPGFYLTEPVPGINEGKLYKFQRTTNGVQLYS